MEKWGASFQCAWKHSGGVVCELVIQVREKGGSKFIIQQGILWGIGQPGNVVGWFSYLDSVIDCKDVKCPYYLVISKFHTSFIKCAPIC